MSQRAAPFTLFREHRWTFGAIYVLLLLLVGLVTFAVVAVNINSSRITEQAAQQAAQQKAAQDFVNNFVAEVNYECRVLRQAAAQFGIQESPPAGVCEVSASPAPGASSLPRVTCAPGVTPRPSPTSRAATPTAGRTASPAPTPICILICISPAPVPVAQRC